MGTKFCEMEIIREKKNECNIFNQIKNSEELLDKVNKYICEIYVDNKIEGMGFFCYIPFPNKSNLLPSLITNNHLINEKSTEINIELLFGNNKKIKKIDLNDNRKIYTSAKYDTTIIEIKPLKDKILFFLELDENINNQN